MQSVHGDEGLTEAEVQVPSSYMQRCKVFRCEIHKVEAAKAWRSTVVSGRETAGCNAGYCFETLSPPIRVEIRGSIQP